MKRFSMFKAVVLAAVAVQVTGCTLSTTGLRPPGDPKLAWRATSEVYDKIPEPAPAPAPVAKTPCVLPTLSGQSANLKGCKTGDKIVLQGLHFAFNSSTLTPEDKALLDLVAAALLQAPGITFEVAGHTDSVGSAEYNQSLSARRVASVVKYLTLQGVPATRMSMKGYGESVPVSDNDTDAGRALNRRVELIILGTGMVSAAPAAAAPMDHAHASPAPAAPAMAAAPAAVSGSQVSIVDNAFEPAILEVDAGTTVVWTNNGGSNHIVQFDDAKSARLRHGAAYSRNFDAPGEYDYVCAIHGSRMSGKVVVS